MARVSAFVDVNGCCTRGIAAFLGVLLLAGCGRIQIQPAGPPVQEPELGAAVAVMADGYTLPLHRWLPEDPAGLIVLGVHGFNDYGNGFANLGEALAASGLAGVYAYDQRGFGATERTGIWPGGATLEADLRTVIQLLRERHPDARLVLIGESMGGAVVLRALAGYPPLAVDGAVLLAPAVWGADRMPWYQRLGLGLLLRIAPGLTITGDSVADLGIRPTDDPEVIQALREDPLVLKSARVDTLHGITTLMTEVSNRFNAGGVPTLFLYGLRDQIIPPGSVCQWLEQLPAHGGTQELQVVLYPGGYHMLTRYTGGAATLDDIVGWLERGDSAITQGEVVELDEARRRICALPARGFRELRRGAVHAVE